MVGNIAKPIGDIIVAVFTDIAPKGLTWRKDIRITISGSTVEGFLSREAYSHRGLKRTVVIVGIKKKRTPMVTMVLIITT